MAILLRFSAGAALCVCLLDCATSAGQKQVDATTEIDVAPPPSSRFPAKWYPAETSVVAESAAPVRNEPYTATLVETSRFEKAENGAPEVSVRRSFTARDAKGRTRTEDPPDYGHGKYVPAHDVRVADPVSHCSFHWVEPDVVTPGGPAAIVTCLALTLRYVSFDPWARLNFASPRETTTELTIERGEPLGRRVFGEVEAIGAHNTITRKNPEPGQAATSGVEVWYAPSIHEIVALKENPATPGGAPEMELTDIHLGDPDPALFYPPSNYRILTMAELEGLHPPPSAAPSAR
jgi:hypothetical protein